MDLKAIIRINLIKDDEVTIEDVTLVEKVHRLDIESIKGKTTQVKPTPVIFQTIDILKELININQDITISIDGLKINRV